MKACPSEEQLSDFIDGNISDKERHTIEDHLSICETCLEEVALAYKMIENEDSFQCAQVTNEITQSALDLTVNKKKEGVLIKIKEKVMQYIYDITDRISELGMVFWAEWQLVPVRGSRVVLARNHSRRRKDFSSIKTDIEIEKTGDNKAQIRVLLNNGRKAGHNIRVILIRRNKRTMPPMLDREVASYIIEDEPVLFEDIPFDHYKLAFSKDGVTLGRYLFQIK